MWNVCQQIFFNKKVGSQDPFADGQSASPGPGGGIILWCMRLLPVGALRVALYTLLPDHHRPASLGVYHPRLP